MKIRGKEIKMETISMWLNVLGFIIGILFYFRLESNSKQIVPVVNPLHDSVLVIDTKLNLQIEALKIQQEQLTQELKNNSQKLIEQNKTVIVLRQQLQVELNADWDSLSKHEQDAFIKTTIEQLKKPQAP